MHSKRYNLPHLAFFQGFEAAARTLSFTKAAEELFITQSAVSRQIKALEDNLGKAVRAAAAVADAYRKRAGALQNCDRRSRSPAERDRPTPSRNARTPALPHHDDGLRFALAHTAAAALH